MSAALASNKRPFPLVAETDKLSSYRAVFQ
jgi:hypothetical protein